MISSTPDLKTLLKLEAEGIAHFKVLGQEWDYSTVLAWMQETHGVSWQHAESELGAYYDTLNKENVE